ncbi:MAG TPA: hypothetical protein VEC38_07715 [Candidatus Binataceae bacterium]|nr:hypothetical protein [Candidatus Binataceae bacterium]
MELGLTAVIAGLICAGLPSSRAWAQAAPDVYRLNYYANAHTRTPDETVRIVNPTPTTLCADIYVFDANQNEQECCSCPITHNGLLTLSVNRDLTSNPFTAGTVLTNGVIKIVSAQISPSSAAVVCSAGPTTPTPAPELREWITHYPTALPALLGALTATEEEFAKADLIDPELSSYLAEPCNPKPTPAGTTPGVCTCGANTPD